jgi:hypothetical protein
VATETRTAEIIKERKLNRMRLGQAAVDVVELPSDPEIRIGLVPLTEAEFAICASAMAAKGYGDDTSGLVQADRDMRRQILLLACREINDPQKRMFANEQELQESLDHADVNFLTEQYTALTDASSPSLEGLSEEDMEELKKALMTIDWSALSGRSWYLLKVFLSTISERQLLANLPGSLSTSD